MKRTTALVMVNRDAVKEEKSVQKRADEVMLDFNQRERVLELLATAQHGVKITFTKTDGSIREMRATRNPNALNEKGKRVSLHAEFGGYEDITATSTVVEVFDMDLNENSKFNFNRLVSIELEDIVYHFKQPRDVLLEELNKTFGVKRSETILRDKATLTALVDELRTSSVGVLIKADTSNGYRELYATANKDAVIMHPLSPNDYVKVSKVGNAERLFDDIDRSPDLVMEELYKGYITFIDILVGAIKRVSVKNIRSFVDDTGTEFFLTTVSDDITFESERLNVGSELAKVDTSNFVIEGNWSARDEDYGDVMVTVKVNQVSKQFVDDLVSRVTQETALPRGVVDLAIKYISNDKLYALQVAEKTDDLSSGKLYNEIVRLVEEKNMDTVDLQPMDEKEFVSFVSNKIYKDLNIQPMSMVAIVFRTVHFDETCEINSDLIFAYNNELRKGNVDMARQMYRSAWENIEKDILEVKKRVEDYKVEVSIEDYKDIIDTLNKQDGQKYAYNSELVARIWQYLLKGYANDVIRYNKELRYHIPEYSEQEKMTSILDEVLEDIESDNQRLVIKTDKQKGSMRDEITRLLGYVDYPSNFDHLGFKVFVGDELMGQYKQRIALLKECRLKNKPEIAEQFQKELVGVLSKKRDEYIQQFEKSDEKDEAETKQKKVGYYIKKADSSDAIYTLIVNSFHVVDELSSWNVIESEFGADDRISKINAILKTKQKELNKYALKVQKGKTEEIMSELILFAQLVVPELKQVFHVTTEQKEFQYLMVKPVKSDSVYQLVYDLFASADDEDVLASIIENNSHEEIVKKMNRVLVDYRDTVIEYFKLKEDKQATDLPFQELKAFVLPKIRLAFNKAGGYGISPKVYDVLVNDIVESLLERKYYDNKEETRRLVRSYLQLKQFSSLLQKLHTEHESKAFERLDDIMYSCLDKILAMEKKNLGGLYVKSLDNSDKVYCLIWDLFENKNDEVTLYTILDTVKDEGIIRKLNLELVKVQDVLIRYFFGQVQLGEVVVAFYELEDILYPNIKEAFGYKDGVIPVNKLAHQTVVKWVANYLVDDGEYKAKEQATKKVRHFLSLGEAIPYMNRLRIKSIKGNEDVLNSVADDVYKAIKEEFKERNSNGEKDLYRKKKDMLLSTRDNKYQREAIGLVISLISELDIISSSELTNIKADKNFRQKILKHVRENIDLFVNAIED